MKLEFDLTELVYSIPVPMKQFARLLRWEDKDMGITHPTLCTELEATEGVREVNYDGHFGSFIFVRIEADYNNDDFKSQISDIIVKHLEGNHD